MKPTLSILLLSLWPALSSTGHASTADDLLRCRVMAEPAARLACYDALAPERPAVAAVPVPAAAPPAAAPASGFGFEQRAVVSGPEQIESSIPGSFQGWGPRSQIRLANGQVWQVVDESRAVMDLRDPKVRVSRGTFGTFFLQIQGRNQAPRVKRVE